MLSWANRFSIFLLLDSNGYRSKPGRYRFLLGVRTDEGPAGPDATSLAEVQSLHDEHKDWLFGHINYDYKNELEPKLKSCQKAQTCFPDLYFFRPDVVCYVLHDSEALVIESVSRPVQDVYDEIRAAAWREEAMPRFRFRRDVIKDEYLLNVERLREHIAAGDCYEINYCVEGYNKQVLVDPLSVYRKLALASPAPFAACYRLSEQYMMGASPERYLFRSGNKIWTQPIKGTAPRSSDPERDEENKRKLSESRKDRAENVMITDLMRNDLAHSCETGSIKTEELFGIYSFAQVHQMISTVTGKLRDDNPFTETLRHSFPMGSMTGAPKIKVMELIDRYELSRRELFSGTVGYIDPEGGFDFNVIIRSLFYRADTGRLSFQAGGAITYDSNAEEEWEEMMLKSKAIENLFSPPTDR